MEEIIKMNKKAQSGETITWIIATIIIIVILLISIYGASALAKSKKIITTAKNPSNLFGSDYSPDSDLLAVKSMTGFLLTSDNGNFVYSQINTEGFNEFNGNIAKYAFSDFEIDYKEVWLGIDDETNNYFGEKPGNFVANSVEDEIKLDGKNLKIVLIQ